MNDSSLEKGPFEKGNESSSNHQFSGDILVFRGGIYIYVYIYIFFVNIYIYIYTIWANNFMTEKGRFPHILRCIVVS